MNKSIMFNEDIQLNGNLKLSCKNKSGVVMADSEVKKIEIKDENGQVKSVKVITDVNVYKITGHFEEQRELFLSTEAEKLAVYI